MLRFFLRICKKVSAHEKKIPKHPQQPALIFLFLSTKHDSLPMPTDFQQYLLQAVRRNAAADSTVLAQEVADLLHASKANAYKKLKGEVALSVEDVLRLAQRFGVSLDQYLQNGQSGADSRAITFQYGPKLSTPNSPAAYLKQVHDNFLQVSKLPAPSIRYATNEMPLFHLLACPQIMAFKLYVWSRINWGLAEMAQVKFDPAKFIACYPAIEQHRIALLDLYQYTPSKEYWSAQFLDNILNQIHYYHDAGLFQSLDTPGALLAELRAMLAERYEMATCGTKTSLKEKGNDPVPAAFDLHLNQVAYTNNLILVYAADQPIALYATMDNPHFLSTYDPAMCAEMHHWVEKIENCSVQISKVGEPHRLRLFEALQAKIGVLEKDLVIA
jgi:hypothetical protein